jgi:tRNA A-37 threonylcarbamoyl transferase component Bud32
MIAALQKGIWPMTLIATTLALLAATCLVVGLRVVRPRRNKGRLEIAPRYRSFFQRLGVTEPADFLALPGETPHIVSGHPDRNVARITFTSNGEQWSAFLKREHRVRWRIRVANAVAGFGLSSRSLREAQTLQALQREELPGPEWLAAGEDSQGRAFLLVREAPGRELRAVLATEEEPRQRRRIARQLGAMLARLHTAGFYHPDLYAHHLFLDRNGDSICLLDWQRACLRRTLSWSERCRGLAALHATVDDALATAEERLLFLRAYWRVSAPLEVSWQAAVHGIESQSRRLLARRHVREKRQPPVPAQAWICLEGETLCVTPVLQQRYGERIPDYLACQSEARSVTLSQRRRWPALPDTARALLVQRNQPKSFAQMWPRLRRSSVSTEQRQAALLLRLQRHGIVAPQVLALGQRRQDDGRVQSFLLTEPLADTCSLESWLTYRTRRRTRKSEPERCWSVLRQAGALLRRLHEASCYLDFGPAGCGFAVRRVQGQLEVVLDNVDGLTPQRRQRPRRAIRDLRRMQQMLHWAGCSRRDLDRFQAGYTEGATRSIATSGVPTQSVGTRESVAPRRAPDSFWRRLLLGVCRWRQRPDWPRFAGYNWTERIMDVAVTDRFHTKQGRSTGRWIVTGMAEERTRRLSVYLKRHNELSRWRGCLATLWPWRNWSPAWREWRQLEWARRQGLPVPRTVAVAEYVGPWARLRSCLVVEELDGMVSLQQAIPLAAVRQDARSFRQWKHGLVAEMARLTRMLHDRRCFHKDLYLCHFFISAQDTHGLPAGGWRGRLYLIDLHRLAHQPLLWRIWQTKDLAELLYASEIIGVDARDRLAFWRAYLGNGPHRTRCPWTRWFVLYRWRRYRRHNARRQNALDLWPRIGDSRLRYGSRVLS